MIHLAQVVLLSLILASSMYKLTEIPADLMKILEIEHIQKSKNLARSLATQRDPYTTAVTNQGA